MLHILLLILKIIGIIIAVILGILVLLTCIVLFVPLRYKVAAQWDGTLDGLKAKASCTWFLHLVKVTAQFDQRILRWKVRILFKTLSEDTMDEKEGQAFVEEIEIKSGEEAGSGETTGKAVEEAEKKPRLSERAETEHKRTDEEAPKQKEKQKKGLKEIYEACARTFQKIKCTILDICGKIKKLLIKKENLIAFIEDEVHRTAFFKVKKEALRLLKRLKPKRIGGSVHFGFEDPSYTGKVLALLSLIYPFIGESFHIEPDFEHKVLEGDLLAAGKIRMLPFVALAWNLFWCRAVRETYRHVRSFSLNHTEH